MDADDNWEQGLNTPPSEGSSANKEQPLSGVVRRQNREQLGLSEAGNWEDKCTGWLMLVTSGLIPRLLQFSSCGTLQASLVVSCI